jgi:hypothetical protein
VNLARIEASLVVENNRNGKRRSLLSQCTWGCGEREPQAALEAVDFFMLKLSHHCAHARSFNN